VKREHFICDCESLEHTIRFSYFEFPDDDLCLYIEMFLNKHSSFFKRLWIALKYVFLRKPSKYGDVGEYVIREETAIDMKEFIGTYLTELKRKEMYKIITKIKDKNVFTPTEIYHLYTLSIRFSGFGDMLELWYNEKDKVEKEECFKEIVKTFKDLKENLDIGMSDEDTDWIVYKKGE